jgi:hypothetical protein
MTDRQYVIRAAQLKGVSIIPATRQAPDILGMVDVGSTYKIVVDAKNWAEAREQINKFYRA